MPRGLTAPLRESAGETEKVFSIRQAGGPLCYQPARRAATGKARVNVTSGLMLTLRGGCAVLLFGYLYEPHGGASGATNSGKRGGRVEVFSEHQTPSMIAACCLVKRLRVERDAPVFRHTSDHDIPRASIARRSALRCAFAGLPRYLPSSFALMIP